MKASEAAKASDAAAVKIARIDKVEADKKRAADVLNEKKKRAIFRAQLKDNFLTSIAYGVQGGRRSAIIYINGIGTSDTPADAENNFDNHGYQDIIKQVVKEIQDDGYRVTTELQSTKYRTSHEETLEPADLDRCEFRRVFENSDLLVDDDFETVRSRVRSRDWEAV